MSSWYDHTWSWLTACLLGPCQPLLISSMPLQFRRASVIDVMQKIWGAHPLHDSLQFPHSHENVFRHINDAKLVDPDHLNNAKQLSLPIKSPVMQGLCRMWTEWREHCEFSGNERYAMWSVNQGASWGTIRKWDYKTWRSLINIKLINHTQLL